MFYNKHLSILFYEGLLLVALTSLHQIQSTDLPCLSRPGDLGQGHVCVCNSTYCDTIGRPDSLAPGHYYHYTTSNYTPGFTRTTGTFSNFTRDSEYVFTINSSVVFQEILGFGGASTDSAGLVLQTLPQEAQDKLMESYFGSNGIGYNFLRLPIGATDFSPRDYTLDDTPFDEELEHFSLQYEDFHYKIPLIRRAMTLSDRDIKVIACSWFAPPWMKTSNSPSCGYVLDKYQSAWANYHIKFLQAYKGAGIDVWAISSGNEPTTQIMFGDFCTIANFTLKTVASERAWLRDHLFPQLSAANLSDVVYLTFEDMRPYASYWMNKLAEDPEVMAKVSGVTLHWYWDWRTNATLLDDLHHQFPDKLIMYMESCANFGSGKDGFLGSWTTAETYSHYIIEDLSHWSQSFLDWNLLLNTEGGPSRMFKVNAPIIVNSTSGEFYKQPMFYVLGHFSKFIQPGSRRVQMISSNSRLDQEQPPPYKKFDKPVPFTAPVVPETVEGLATVDSDGCHTIIISNTITEKEIDCIVYNTSTSTFEEFF